MSLKEKYVVCTDSATLPTPVICLFVLHHYSGRHYSNKYIFRTYVL